MLLGLTSSSFVKIMFSFFSFWGRVTVHSDMPVEIRDNVQKLVLSNSGDQAWQRCPCLLSGLDSSWPPTLDPPASVFQVLEFQAQYR